MIGSNPLRLFDSSTHNQEKTVSSIIHTASPAPVRVAMVCVSAAGVVTVADEPYLGVKFQDGNEWAPHLIVWSDQDDGPVVVEGREQGDGWQRVSGPASESSEMWDRRITEAVAAIRRREADGS